MHSFLTRVAIATDHGQDGVPGRKFGMTVNQRPQLESQIS